MIESIIMALNANLQVLESIPKSHYKKREAADKSVHLYRALAVYLLGEDARYVEGRHNDWSLLQEWDGESLIFESGEPLLEERRIDFQIANDLFHIEEGFLGPWNIIRVGTCGRIVKVAS